MADIRTKMEKAQHASVIRSKQVRRKPVGTPGMCDTCGEPSLLIHGRCPPCRTSDIYPYGDYESYEDSQ